MNPVKISTELLSTKQEKELQPQQDGGKYINDKVDFINTPQGSASFKKTAKRSLSQLRGFRPAGGQIIQVNNLALFPSDEVAASSSSIHELKPQIMQSSSGQNTPSAVIEDECEVIYPVNLSHRFKPQAKRKQSYNQLKASVNPTVLASKQPQVIRFGSQNGIISPPLNIQNILQNEFLSNYQQINSHRSSSKPPQSYNDLSAGSENINDSFPMTARDSSQGLSSTKKQNDFLQKISRFNNPASTNNFNKTPNNVNAETAQFRNTVAKLLSRKTSQHSPYYPHSQLDQKSINKPLFDDQLDSASQSCQLYSARSTSATKVSSSKRCLLPLRKESSTFLPPLQDSTNFDRSTSSSSVQEDNIQSAPILQDNIESNEGENSKSFRDFKTPNQYKHAKVNICSVSADKVKGSNWERSGGNKILKSNSVSRGSQCPNSFDGKEGVVVGQSYLNYNSVIVNGGQSEDMRNGQQLNQNSAMNNMTYKAADSANQILQNALKKGAMQSSHKKNEPKVLSPSGLKNQKVFRLPHHSDGRSNSCNPQNKANFSHLNNSTNAFNLNQAFQAATSSVNNKHQNNQSQQHFNFISNGFYPLLSEKKQSRYQNSNNSNNNNMVQINEILDQSVEEFLEYKQIPAIEPSKTSKKQIGVISAFAANTHMGTVRNYNEDRVSIILNIAKPKNKPEELHWPSASFFAIYDGHGGNNCAEFLKENLHHYIVKDDNYPGDPEKAIENGFAQIEKDFLEKADKQQPFDRSGSCAIVALIIEKKIYIGNVGDSRAVLSSNLGKICLDLSEDHKPSLPSEEQRIKQFGGHVYRSIVPIYQNHSSSQDEQPSMHGNGQNNTSQAQEYIKGPPRAFPGRLSVSRTIGDAEAKLSQYGGIQGVISPEPEIKIKDIEEDDDFLILGCDGIFDKLTSQEAIQACWAAANEGNYNPHEFSGKAIEDLLRLSMVKNSYDNVTAVMIGLNNVKKHFETKS